MRFQPGANRYFGATAKPAAPISSSVLSFLQSPRSSVEPPRSRPTKPIKSGPFVIAKKERAEITKSLLKTPHYVPTEATRSLKKFAQKIMSNREQYSKAEQKFAEATVHSNQVIKDAARQKEFIQGETEALVALKDRHIDNPYAFSHRSSEIARQTLKTVKKESFGKNTSSTAAERRIKYRADRDDGLSSGIGASAAPGWTAPVPLSGGDESSANEPEVTQFSGGAAIHADGLHHTAMSGWVAGEAVAGRAAQIIIVSDQLPDQEFSAWQTNLPGLSKLRTTSAGLIRSASEPPALVVVDGTGSVDLSKVLADIGPAKIAVVSGTHHTGPVSSGQGQEVETVTGRLDLETLKKLLADQKRAKNGRSLGLSQARQLDAGGVKLPDLSHVDEGLPF